MEAGFIEELRPKDWDREHRKIKDIDRGTKKTK